MTHVRARLKKAWDAWLAQVLHISGPYNNFCTFSVLQDLNYWMNHTGRTLGPLPKRSQPPAPRLLWGGLLCAMKVAPGIFL